jgi:hypothetical protein
MPETPFDWLRSRDANRRPRFQFSLVALLVLMTVVALLLGFSAYIIDAMLLGPLLAFAFYLPAAALAACAVYGRGDYQAFALGALIPWVATMIDGIPYSWSGLGVLIRVVLIAAGCGCVSVFTRRWIKDRKLGDD